MEFNTTQTSNEGELIYGNVGCNVGAWQSRSSSPPFLWKLYEMVDDPETNGLISWSSSKKSFIIWDKVEFSDQLLPKHFKHKTFANFHYQLNIYGFRKVDRYVCEYANPWFQEGKYHWLNNIKRRNTKQIAQEEEISTPSVQNLKAKMEAIMEKLKSEQIHMDREIQKLREREAKLNNEVAKIRESAQTTQAEEQKMVVGLIPDYIQLSVIHHMINNQELDGTETAKIQRQAGPESIVIAGEPANDHQKATATSEDIDHFAFWRKMLEASLGQEGGGRGGQSPQPCGKNVQADDSSSGKVREILNAELYDTDGNHLRIDSSETIPCTDQSVGQIDTRHMVERTEIFFLE